MAWQWFMDSDGTKSEIKGSKSIGTHERKQGSCSETWTKYTIRMMNFALSLLISKAETKTGWLTQFQFSDKGKHSSL